MSERDSQFEEELRAEKAKKAAKNRALRREKKRRKNSVYLLLVIALFLLVGMGYYIRNLEEKAASYAAREAELSSEIASEQQRTEDLKEQSKLRQTLRYIEMIAREKLGLVFPDETIVKPKE